MRLTEERLGSQTYSCHLEACNGNLTSHLPGSLPGPRSNPFNFILNLFKSRRTEKSLKAKFVHRELNESEHFNGDSVFDDSNDNNLETMNLNVGDDRERTQCRGSARSSGARCRTKMEKITSSPDDEQSYLNVYDIKNPDTNAESPDDTRRPHSRRGFVHSSSTRRHTDSPQRLAVSRRDNPHMRHYATSDWDPEDTDTTYGDDHDPESDMYLIRSPPPVVAHDKRSLRQHKHATSLDCEKTDARGGAVDKLLVHRSDVASIAYRGPKASNIIDIFREKKKICFSCVGDYLTT